MKKKKKRKKKTFLNSKWGDGGIKENIGNESDGTTNIKKKN